MVHQSLRDPLGNNLRKHFFSQNIEVVSILWTSMNVDVISLSDSSLQDAKGYLFSSVKFQTICTPQFVPQLKSLRRKIGWRSFFFGTPCIRYENIYWRLHQLEIYSEETVAPYGLWTIDKYILLKINYYFEKSPGKYFWKFYRESYMPHADPWWCSRWNRKETP